MTEKNILTGLFIALFVCCLSMSFTFIRYLRKYRVIQTIIARLRGKTEDYNKHRIEQIQLKLENEKEFRETKYNVMDRMYLTIRKLGILNVFPGFNEFQILSAYAIILGIIWMFVKINEGTFIATVAVAAIHIIIKILCSFIIYEKKERLEAQLSVFINACDSAAMIHSDIIDIFGDVCERMRNPLRRMLEDCYFEAKKTNDKRKALKKLKESTESLQFRSVINNLELCSNVTGDYRKVIDDIRDPIRIYQSYKKKKQAIVRNGRVKILFMCTVSLIILFACTKFIVGLKDILLHTPVGSTLLVLLGITLVAGVTIKAND